MKSILSSLLILLLFDSVLAQGHVTFFDKNWNTTYGSNPSYKQVLIKKEGLYETTIYKLPENQLYMVKTYENKNLNTLQGYYSMYFDNGNLREEGFYEKNEKSGVWKLYYPNGQIKNETAIRGDSTVYLGYWNENGEQILEEGTGSTTYISELKGHKTTIEIRDSVLFAEYYIRDKEQDTIHVYTDSIAGFSNGGMNGFYKFLSEKIQYPESARRMRLQGRVFVEFLVMKDGTLENINVVKGVDPIIDNEALRAVSLTNGMWDPSIHINKKVNSVLTVPVAFRLN